MKISDFSFEPSSLDDFFSPRPVNVRKASFSPRVRIASESDLRGFLKVAKDKLIHISTQDFWSLDKDENGDFFISRLADDSQGPIKE
jgi:hypothetical protein